MRKIWAFLPAICFALTACGELPENRTEPLMGLSWFEDYDAVKSECSAFSLIGERETGENENHQKMLDYADASLYETTCDLTLCFTDSGLIGLNYHDVTANLTYPEWSAALEAKYGLPTEEGSGMASWYDNPLGKNTAVYLFNLEEGVQISFYATADSPDRDYENPRPVPTPEIRTPIVPVGGSTRPGTTEALPSEAISEVPETAAESHHRLREGQPVSAGTTAAEASTEAASETDSTKTTAVEKSGAGFTPAVTNAAQQPTAANTETTNTENPTEATTEPDRRQAFLQNGLQFYSNSDAGRRSMSGFTQLYEYRTEETGQPWELIMEYENVPYLGKSCDGVLCFTSLGLVGVNYFDANTADYNFWVQTLTGIYGSPDETQYDYTAWSSSPVGDGTMIYVFALEDGVQISFFADDTGSELT